MAPCGSARLESAGQHARERARLFWDSSAHVGHACPIRHHRGSRRAHLRAVWRQPPREPGMGSGASKHRRELRRVQAAHVLTNTLRHNNRVQQRHRERAELDALRDEVAILRKRCGDCTHGDVEKDVAERETVIRELEAMLRGPQGKGAARPVAVLTIEKLRGEIEAIRARVPALAAR